MKWAAAEQDADSDRDRRRRLPDGEDRETPDRGTDLRRGCMAKGVAGVRKIQVYLQDAPGRKEAAHKADR